MSTYLMIFFFSIKGKYNTQGLNLKVEFDKDMKIEKIFLDLPYKDLNKHPLTYAKNKYLA